MVKIIIFIYGFVLLIPNLYSQSIVTLNQPEYGYQEHCATLKVHFQLGYSYTPTSTEYMHAYIDSSCLDGVDVYTKVFKKLDGGYYVAKDDKIFLEYTEDYTVGTSVNMSYKFYTEYDLQSGTGTAVALNVGNNRRVITFPISPLPGFYILEIENSKKEKRFLRFKIA